MKLDPTSPDWPDLKGNSCAAQAAGESDTVKAKPKFECAYAAFSQEYTLEPARVDSLFFQKIIFVAADRRRLDDMGPAVRAEVSDQRDRRSRSKRSYSPAPGRRIRRSRS